MFKIAFAAFAFCLISANVSARTSFEVGGTVIHDDRYVNTLDVRGWTETSTPFRRGRGHSRHHAHPVRAQTPRHVTEWGAKRMVRSARLAEAPHRAGLVTVPTAAGIPITVASSVAKRFVGFIADLVASGARPSTIHCAASGGHVRHSLHYWGGACDFNGSASRWAPMNQHRVTDLARKWGLRDGCSFQIRGGRADCGHIDAPGYGVRARYAGK